MQTPDITDSQTVLPVFLLACGFRQQQMKKKVKMLNDKILSCVFIGGGSDQNQALRRSPQVYAGVQE